ncbi:tetratricopeptide repeat protein [Pseudoxanthomonas sp.]|uniref:tetratricopeptide repeat protein n=1 Tax=Pseudoxanthomonas sp. TaxID=1871049 RepID=UPI0025860126|nr:tetratricopeptide repeat protein [Pseudoxanthomonas sp.]MCR6686411.1 tetratricopeptide repeat protein [Pseudoxanthomonas sp.]
MWGFLGFLSRCNVGVRGLFSPYLLLTGLILLAYGKSVGNGYVWDDRYFLVDFGWLDSLSAAWRTAFSPLFMAEAYVRPLPLLSLYADNLAGEHRTAVSHAVNVVLHLVSTLLVLSLARDAFRSVAEEDAGRDWKALVMAALFAVHPALTEAVVWVSSRFDLMATLFMLTGLWLATRDRLSATALAFCLSVVFLLAALSKELAAVFPLLLAIFVTLRESAISGSAPTLRQLLRRRWLLSFGAMFLAGCVYLAIRYHVLSGATGVVMPAYDLEQFARTCATIALYLRLTFLPFAGNSPQHTFVWDAQAGLIPFLPQLVASALLVLVTAILLFRRKPLGWVLLAWGIGYVLVIHLVPINIGNNTVQQRFMYLPTAVLLGLLPYGIPALKLSVAARRASAVLVGMLLLASVLVVRSIVPVWKEDFSLWTWARQIDPKSAMARENLIWAYLDAGMYTELDREVELLTQDGIVTTLNAPLNVGVSHYNRGNFERALFYYEFGLANISTGTAMQQSALYSNLAAAYALVERDREASEALAKAVQINPANHVALANLLAFCRGRDIDLSHWDPVVVRRAEERVGNMTDVLGRYRKGDDLSALCPYPGRG